MFLLKKGPSYCHIKFETFKEVLDAESIEEGMKNIKAAIKAAVKLYMKQGDPIPEPIDKKKFKGNIAYRTSSERHYQLAKIALRKNTSLSKTLDLIVDTGIDYLQHNARR